MVSSIIKSVSCALVVALALVVVGGGRAQPERAAPPAFGDIDGDGRRDAALVVEVPPDDPLAAVYLAVFAEHRAGWRPLATIRLDDGAVVERLRIVPGRLTATYRRHYPVDPPGRPSNETVRSWVFADGVLHGGRAVEATDRWARAAARLPR